VNPRLIDFQISTINMRSLRILQIVPSLEQETGGPARSVAALGRDLADLGHNVVLYTTTWPKHGKQGEPPVRRKDGTGYEIVTFQARRSLFFPNMPYSPELVQNVLEHCREFDIVHNFSIWNPVATFSLRALQQTGTPYCLSPLGMLDPVVIRRNRWKKLPWWFLWERANVSEAALIHFTTSLEEERSRGCCRLRHTIVVPHLVDLKNWKVLPDRSVMESRFPKIRGHEVILFVGRINWVKNLDLLLKAVVIVREKRKKAMLVCVGPDNEGYQADLEKQARELGIEEYVLFTGMLGGDDLKSAYSCANAFALVSQKENFGHTAAEALASGIPVVLGNEVGIGSDLPVCDVVHHVVSDSNQIASALVKILERTAAIGLPDPEARSVAEKTFRNSEGIILADAYYEVLSQHRRSELNTQS
jgi:glycosyltransferase involved in cell wall biosynthesis